MLRRLYLSALGLPISLALNLLGRAQRPFMVYGYFDRGRWRKHVRVSSTAVLGDRASIAIADNVWIWHHSIIDGSNGVTIGEGSQIGAWVGVFSHGSQVAVRLHGRDYINVPREERLGYTRAPVRIGRYCFLGAGALVLPGVELGDGCLVAAGAVVTGSAPAFSILRGNPAKIVGDVRKLDAKFWSEAAVRESYFDPDAMRAFIETGAAADAGA